MASKLVDEENAGTCSICIECFKHPKLLPCFHSFCLGCLEQYTSKKALSGRFPCPVCRFEVILPPTGVNGFQTNFYIEAQTIKDGQAGGLCEVCSQNAVNRCQECEQLLCEHCTNVHSSLKLTRSHTLIRLEETTREKPVLSKPEFCPKHKGELFRFHCQKCKKAICRDCKLTSHERHPTVDLEDVIEKGRRKLSKVKVELEEIAAAFERKLQVISGNKDKFNKSIFDIEKNINALADALIAIINEKRQDKLKEVNVLRITELHHLVTMETCLKQEKTFLEGHIGHVTTLLTGGCGADVFNTLPDMKQRLREIKSGTEVVEVTDKKPLTFLLNWTNPMPNEISLGRMNQTLMNIVQRSFDPTLNFEATTHRGSIDFICPAYRDKVWVAIRMPIGMCYLKLFDCSGGMVKCFHLSGDLYENLRLRGVHGILNGLKGGSKEIQAMKADINRKCKPYSDTEDGRTCSVDVLKKVVVVTDANGDKELELSALEMQCAEDFSPRDVCWGQDGRIFIADGGTNSIIVYTPEAPYVISVKVKCGHFEPCAVANTGKGVLVGDTSGRIFRFP